MSNELKYEVSKSKLDKLSERLYYDLNYFKIINKLGVFPFVLKSFQKHLKEQIEDFLASGDNADEHKNILKNKVKEFSGKGIFLENKIAFAKYVFTFKLSDLIVVYVIKSDDILSEKPPFDVYKFNSVNFLSRFLQNDLKANEAIIYTYNFSTSDIDSIKAKLNNPSYTIFNKKMSMELSAGGVISFDDF